MPTSKAFSRCDVGGHRLAGLGLAGALLLHRYIHGGNWVSGKLPGGSLAPGSAL